MAQRSFPCLIYKADNAFYQNGTYATISCNQVKIGDYGMNTVGEIVPLPNATSPLVDTALVPEGTVFPSPSAFGDSGFKKVTQVKDMDSLTTYFCDTDAYNLAIQQCNPIPPPPAVCATVSGLGVPVLGSTHATITWVLPTGAIGIEYVLDQSGSSPSGDGTYVDGSTPTVTITGLTPSTTYTFHIRTICGLGVRSAWRNNLSFGTPS